MPIFFFLSMTHLNLLLLLHNFFGPTAFENYEINTILISFQVICLKMPQKKQPLSLFWTCIFDVSKMIQDASDKIFNASCTTCSTLFNNDDYTSKLVEEVQHYFCDPLPYLLLEMVCNQRHLSAHVEKPQTTKKLTIFLQIVMHKNLTIFHIPRLNMLPYQLNSIPESFWCQTLSNMNKIKHLNLSNVCTDELLRVISDNCPLLEDIKIVSKSRNMSAEFNFNALRKGYHVTDNGLISLTKCKKLKRINIGVARVHNRQITPKSIATLLRELPDLRAINYPHMDQVLQLVSSSQQFKIQHITDQNCTLQHVQLYIRHFPNLVHLHLELSKGGDLSKENQYQQTTPIMQLLKNSNLKLSGLALSSFWVTTDVLLEFLSVKGANLLELGLDSKSCEVDAQTLQSIGQMCPFLVQLVVKHLETGDFCTHIPSKLFPYLQNLSFATRNSWDVSKLLSILLQGGRLTVFNIDVCYNLSNMNAFFRDFFVNNQLLFLRKVVFGGSALIDQLTVENFYKKCPKLKFLMCSESLVQLKRETFLDDLRTDITTNNYDFDLFIFE